jgi:hypothetical protein
MKQTTEVSENQTPKGMFLDISVSTRQAHASHTSNQNKVYVRPRGITRSFLAVLHHFWHPVL